VSPEEEKVPLIVKGDYLSTPKLGERGKEGTEKAADRVPEESREVVEDELGCARSIELEKMRVVTYGSEEWAWRGRRSACPAARW
jgi:hypothetical protein